MFRTAFALLLAAAVPALGQPPVEPKDGKVVFPLTVSAAPALKPASAANLLPEYRESIPGNRVQMFLRCFMEQDQLYGKVETDKRQKWHEMPLEDLPAETAQYAGFTVSRNLYDAARMTTSDWQIWSFLKRDGIETLLPDVQKMRAHADVLKVRVRAEIKANDFVAARQTLRTMFGLAKTLDSHPTLIAQLVGISIAYIAVDAVQELIARPGSPNLFWGLTDLPAPLFDLRMAVEGERVLISEEFAALLKPTGSYPEEELIRLATRLDYIARVGGEKEMTFPKYQYALWAADAKRVAAARARLVELGLKADVVKAMPPLQVTLSDDVWQYEVIRDENIKYLTLPFHIAMPAILAGREALKARRADLIMAPSMVPFMERAKSAQARLDQRIAALRIIEAVRLTAHTTGALPATLDDIKLPLPADPVTGKAFAYAVADGVATLSGGNPRPGDASTNRHYEIRLRK